MENFFDQIDRYVSDELPEEDRKAFEKAMKNDAELKEEVRLQQLIINKLEAHAKKPQGINDFKARLADIEQNLAKTEKPAEQASLFVRYRYAIISTVAVAAALILFLLIPVAESEIVFPNPPQANFTQMSGTGSILQEAGRAYNAKSYAEAIQLFQAYLAQEPEDYEALYFQGISYFELQQWTEATTDFEILSKSDSILKDDALFYLALIQLKQENKSDASQLLQQIQEGTPAFLKAQKLLKQL